MQLFINIFRVEKGYERESRQVNQAFKRAGYGESPVRSPVRRSPGSSCFQSCLPHKNMPGWRPVEKKRPAAALKPKVVIVGTVTTRVVPRADLVPEKTGFLLFTGAPAEA